MLALWSELSIVWKRVVVEIRLALMFAFGV
jgi:hypothetical protein